MSFFKKTGYTQLDQGNKLPNEKQHIKPKTECKIKNGEENKPRFFYTQKKKKEEKGEKKRDCLDSNFFKVRKWKSLRLYTMGLFAACMHANIGKTIQSATFLRVIHDNMK